MRHSRNLVDEMNMISEPENNAFRQLLSDYMSETPDTGFSDHVVQQFDRLTQRETRIRRWGLLGAFFVGGIVAGSQFPSLMDLLRGIVRPLEASLSETPLNGSTLETGAALGMSLPIWAIAAGCVIACSALMMMDDRSSRMF